MSKINLLINEKDFTTFQSKYIVPVLTEYFNIITFDENTTYDKSNTLVVTNSHNTSNIWYSNLVDNGFKILIDRLWETDSRIDIPNSWICHAEKFFWYNECLWYTALNLNKYQPNKTYTKTAFMPMRLKRYHRDILFEQLQRFLDKCIYSYNARGYFLPNDGSITGPEFQRFFNSEWYDATYFSIVAESVIEPLSSMFITEKSFKPIAFYHPYMIVGQKGTLSTLKSFGFETYENIFDESYDFLDDVNERILRIVNNFENFDHKKYDTLTLAKIEHNHNLFFNKDLVIENMKKEIIEPILEFANEQ